MPIMQKQKENQFLNKFRLLNSQEHTEEIIWSLSDSSEYDDSCQKLINLTNKTRNLKRKRNKKAPKNISNLSITLLDTSKHSKDAASGDKSPILISKHPKSINKSPILTQSSKRNSILPTSSINQKSPILTHKSNSPKCMHSIRKKLFSYQKQEEVPNTYTLHNKIIKTEPESDLDIDSEDNKSTCPSKIDLKEETTKTKRQLLKNVKTFFDCHFSSESSQNSQPISDILTQKNKSNSSEEIISHKTLSNESCSKKPIVEYESDASAENSFYTKKSKKVNYKKNGLSYRLDNLLRKKNACLSLWHHERFLKENSNFIIPKEEHSCYRILKINFKYGCYLLEALDNNDDNYLILINSCFVTNNILCDTVIKIYEPFKTIMYDNIKLLINVCRFECKEYNK